MQLIDLECQKDLYALFKTRATNKESFYLILSPDKADVRQVNPSADVLGVTELDDASLCYILALSEGERDRKLMIELHRRGEDKKHKHLTLKESLPTSVLCHHLNRRNKRLYWVGRGAYEEDDSLIYVQLDLDTEQASVFKGVIDPKINLTHMAVTHNALGGLTYFTGKNDQGHFEVSCLNETTGKLNHLQETDDHLLGITPTSIKGLHAAKDTVCVTHEVISVTSRGLQRVNRCVVFHRGEFKAFFTYPRASIYYTYYRHEDDALWVFSSHGVLYVPKDPRSMRLVKSTCDGGFNLYLPWIEDGAMMRIYRYSFTNKEFQDPVILIPDELFS